MTVAEAVFTPVRFALRGLPERDRIPFWREVFGRKIVRCEIDPPDEGAFNLEATLRELPDLHIFHGRGARGVYRRTRALISDGRDDFALFVGLKGRAAIEQRGRDVELGPGSAVLVSHSDAGRLVHSNDPFVSLIVPRVALAGRLPEPADATMRVIPRETEALRLLVAYLSVLRSDTFVASAELRRLAAVHIHDLVALVIGCSGDTAVIARRRGVRAARLHAVKAHIAAHLAARDLSVTTAARRQGVTPRYLQMLFEEEGISFSQFVLGQRLDHARRMLADPRADHMTITAIAYASGFGDLSHFNHTFRLRYGATPKTVRAATPAGPEAP